MANCFSPDYHSCRSLKGFWGVRDPKQFNNEVITKPLKVIFTIFRTLTKSYCSWQKLLCIFIAVIMKVSCSHFWTPRKLLELELRLLVCGKMWSTVARFSLNFNWLEPLSSLKFSYCFIQTSSNFQCQNALMPQLSVENTL